MLDARVLEGGLQLLPAGTPAQHECDGRFAATQLHLLLTDFGHDETIDRLPYLPPRLVDDGTADASVREDGLQFELR